MNKKFKKAILAFSSLGIITAPVVAVVSCSASTKKSYDFGLATAPINSLNYIKYKNTSTVATALVEGLFKTGSSDKTIQTQLSFPAYNFKIATGSATHASLASSYLPLGNWGFLPGSTISSSTGNPYVGLAASPDLSTYSQLAFQLNDKHQWSRWNNSDPNYGKTGERKDIVSGKDYIDALKYILDINTGSQFVIDLLEFGIKNAQTIYDLQNEYYLAFHQTYIDPFGYGDKGHGKWQPQLTDTSDKKWSAADRAKEVDLVAKIKAAALAFGVFTADQIADNTVEGVDKIDWLKGSTAASVDEKHQLFFQFETSKPFQRSKVDEFARRAFFLPVNRDFIETHGGIQKFGIDKEHLLWNSAFIPTTINLGPAGYIDLEKDPDYYAADRTVSNSIKIYFQSDPTVLASMFEDGYISDVRIPAVQQLNFWSNPEIRRFMFKSNGFGTLAFELNLDKQTGNPALQDDNLRKAIAYSIDRNALSLVAGQESSFPVTTWSAFGQAKDTTGTPIETFFDGLTYQPTSSADHQKLVDDLVKQYVAQGVSQADAQTRAEKEIPAALDIQSYPYTVHNAKILQFERVNREDIGHNEAYAKYFLEQYKLAHPGAQPIKLTYIYDGQTVNKNIGIYLQAQLNRVLGGFVNIEIKGLPANVFETYKTTGDFDILFYNFDSYGTQWNSYVKRFFKTDEIEGETKTQGFRDNPSGSWTYQQFFDKISSNEEDIRQQLDIEPAIWQKVKELAKADVETTDGFFAKLDKNPITDNGKTYDFQEDKNIIMVVAALEKIIRYDMPVLPLMEVDTYWEAKRVYGVDSLYSFALQTAYDVEHKPNPALPGLKS